VSHLTRNAMWDADRLSTGWESSRLRVHDYANASPAASS